MPLAVGWDEGFTSLSIGNDEKNSIFFEADMLTSIDPNTVDDGGTDWKLLAELGTRVQLVSVVTCP